MILLAILACALLILIGIAIVGAVGGTIGGLIIFAEPIIAGLMIYFIIRGIVRRKRRH